MEGRLMTSGPAPEMRWSDEEEDRVIGELVEQYPEADAPTIAQAALDALYEAVEQHPEGDAEVAHVLRRLRTKAREQWACPDG